MSYLFSVNDTEKWSKKPQKTYKLFLEVSTTSHGPPQ